MAIWTATSVKMSGSRLTERFLRETGRGSSKTMPDKTEGLMVRAAVEKLHGEDRKADVIDIGASKKTKSPR